MTSNKGRSPRRVEYRPHPDPEKAKRGEKVKGVFLDFNILKEDWNIYELEDGTRVRIKISPSSFVKPLDLKTGEIIYKKGKPVYGMDIGVEAIVECPEEFVKP